MPPDGEFLKGLMNFGLAGMLFYMWFMQNRKETALQDVIKEQVEDKRQIRDDRTELIKIIRDQSTQNTRIADALQRVESFLSTHAR